MASKRDTIFPAPTDPADWPVWQRTLRQWRDSHRELFAFDDSLYARPEKQWVAQRHVAYLLMVWDGMFYDPRQGRYTVDAFLDRCNTQFGGIDLVLIWNTYPRTGVDPRTQFDHWRDVPGGLPALREAVERFHARDVKVTIPYKHWDTQTRDGGGDHLAELADLARQLDIDGVFLDCAAFPRPGFREALEAVKPGIMFYSEATSGLDHLHENEGSWMQFVDEPTPPSVARNRWYEPRHMIYETRRYATEQTAELHRVWLNGSAVMIWENVFGYWCGTDGRYRSILRAMTPIFRRYAALFTEGEWTPAVATEAADVYAHRREHQGMRLWSLVNRAEQPREGRLVEVEHRGGDRYFDLVAGREIEARLAGGRAKLNGAIRSRGIGALLALPGGAVDEAFERFLADQAAIHGRAEWTTEPAERVHTFTPVEHRLQSVSPTRPYSDTELPEGMARIDPPATWELVCRYRMRECGFIAGTETQMHPYDAFEKTCTDRRTVSMGPYAIDLTPVTNAEFAAFLESSGYRPTNPERFLAHWEGDRPPRGLEEHPVVYVDLDDARTYAAWAGRRLPTEPEWQYAAQGGDRRTWPWGDEFDASRCNGGQHGGTTAVGRYPDGRSPVGCDDMAGNVWEWTESERDDGHTRYCIVRGGSWWTVPAVSSHWYFDTGPQPADWASKLLLMGGPWDRAATIGFRCVVDRTVD